MKSIKFFHSNAEQVLVIAWTTQKQAIAPQVLIIAWATQKEATTPQWTYSRQEQCVAPLDCCEVYTTWGRGEEAPKNIY